MDGAFDAAARGVQGERGFLGVCALLFAAGVAATIASCASMSAMEGMAMPGGWTLSMAWMRMPGQAWPEIAASLLGMWLAMMVAMMLPSLVPMLQRYRQAVGVAGPSRLGWLTALAGAGYFFVWMAVGAAVLPLGCLLAQAELRMPAWARAVPVLAGAAVLLAGALQLSAWKVRRLACCRAMPAPGRELPAVAGVAWRQGMRLGIYCSACCSPLMAILLAAGLMDLRAMAAVTCAITAERLMPAGETVAQAIGAVAVAAGALLIMQAIALQ